MLAKGRNRLDNRTTTIRVEGLPQQCKQQSVVAHFSVYGLVVRAEMIMNVSSAYSAIAAAGGDGDGVVDDDDEEEEASTTAATIATSAVDGGVVVVDDDGDVVERNTGVALVQFRDRRAAESAMRKCKRFAGQRLRLCWSDCNPVPMTFVAPVAGAVEDVGGCDPAAIDAADVAATDVCDDAVVAAAADDDVAAAAAADDDAVVVVVVGECDESAISEECQEQDEGVVVGVHVDMHNNNNNNSSSSSRGMEESDVVVADVVVVEE